MSQALGPAGFLDAASGQQLHPAGRTAWLAAADRGWADPARLHHPGRQAALFLAAAREELAAGLGVRPDQLAFAPSGSAAIAHGVRRLAEAGRAVTSAVEHSAVGAALRARSGPLVEVGVDRFGRVDPAELAAAAARDGGAALVVLQTANHEVGTRQPVADVAALLDGVPLLVDAAASIGREPVPAGWSLLAASAHKWGGPAGLGVLADVRPGRSPVPDLEPVDIPAAVAAAASLSAVLAERDAEAERARGLVTRLREQLPVLIPDVELAGHPDDRLPHVLNLSCLYLDGEALVTELDRAGLYVSSGSACASTSGLPSHVLAAMGVLTHGNVRVSLPIGVDSADVDRLLVELPAAVARLRAGLGGLDG